MLALNKSSKTKRFNIFRFLIFISFLLIYQIITLINQAFPPLIGIFFTLVVFLKFEYDNTSSVPSIKWYLAMIYLCFVEQIHGFMTFSILITFVVYYYFIFDWMLRSFKFRNLLVVFCVMLSYAGIFLISNFLSYAYKTSYLKFTYEYFVYIVFESIISLIIFRGKILCD